MSKYRVYRSDGQDEPGGRHDGCRYLVLDLTHDPTARHVALVYGALRLTEGPADEDDAVWARLLIEQVRALDAP